MKNYTKKELIEKLNEQQTKLNMCIETLIGYASKGWNKKPAEMCLYAIGVEKIEWNPKTTSMPRHCCTGMTVDEWADVKNKGSK